MKYRFSLRKYWWSWLKQDIWKFIYSKFYGFNMNSHDGTILPDTGKGEFVSVYSKGKIIQIKQESGDLKPQKYDEIRIIPCQYNHGVFVERFTDGKIVDRHILTINNFNTDIMFSNNLEQLVEK